MPAVAMSAAGIVFHMCGRLAQLAERQFYTLEAGGSNPSPPTIPSPGTDFHDCMRPPDQVLKYARVPRAWMASLIRCKANT